MFFRRGRLSVKKARALLIELFDHRYQWSLRIPVAHLLARGDPLRFLCSLRFLVDQVGQGVFLLNRRRPPERLPWFADDLETAVGDLPLRPANLAERLASVMRLNDPIPAEVEARRLLLEIIDLAPKEKRRDQEEDEQRVVSWLLHIADPEVPSEPLQAPGGNQVNLMRLARRAVRIVWRLPGSRLATLAGSVAAGYADLTSDIDIGLFGLKLPEARVRRSLIAATSDAAGDITQVSQKNYAEDTFWLEGRLTDVRYFLIEEARRLIEHPVPESRADHELLAHLSTAKVLVDYEFRGPDLLLDLQRATQQARPKRITRASAELDQALARLAVARDGPAVFYATVEAILALFQLLAAHNDRWIVFPKWTAAWLDGLEHVPADVHQRLSAIALLPFHPENIAAKAETLRALADETRAW
jgi:predicted nucleotidyltransferase